MQDKKPELILYIANCNSEGCSEGHFDIEKEDKWEVQRHIRAMHIVQKYLGYGWGVNLSGIYDLVKSEKEAQELLKICENEFGGVNLTIRLSNCAHGQINFKRTLEFSKHNLEDRASLIEKMKDIDYIKNKNINPEKLSISFDKRYLF